MVLWLFLLQCWSTMGLSHDQIANGMAIFLILSTELGVFFLIIPGLCIGVGVN